MSFFQSIADLIPEYRELKQQIKENNPGIIAISGLSCVHKAHFIAALSQAGESSSPLLVLAETENEALRLCDDVNAFGVTAAVYPAKDLNLISADTASKEYEYRRISVLSELSIVHCTLSIVIATPEAAAQYTLSPSELTESIIHIKKDTELNVENLLKDLVNLGYTRCDMLESVSQFSVRGSIIDIFPINAELPVRIDLWGEAVERITHFDVVTQRSVNEIDEVRVPPAVETFGKATLFDFVRNIVVCEHVNCNEQFKSAEVQLREDITLLVEAGKTVGRYMLSKSEYNAVIESRARAFLNTFARGGGISVNAVQLPPWNGNFKQLKEDLNSFIKNGYALVIFAGTEKAARSLALDLRDDGFSADYTENPKKHFLKHIYVMSGTLSAGYDYPNVKCACITYHGIARRNTDTSGTTWASAPARTPKKKKRSEAIRSLTDINVGDYIVHDNHGIGIFEGVHKLKNDNVSQDYIKIQYAGKSVLYIPVTQLDFISRYIGNTDTATLKLSKLHTDSWAKAKSKAKKAASELAEELIELYAKRMKSKGHAFAKDTREQEEFENRFSYIETDDQLVCINELKKDMQREEPMDRLLCGDVGFGKTEVALRGAFKCVMEGKQCALLCPTTVLAWQHYQTAMQRMEGFPVNIELLSRFRSAKEQKQVIEKLEKGIVDFVIGTHRLVGKDVKFNNLGLVIIDEEQRFGVSQKEKLKEAFSGVDVLTLSATPIPRTLNMAMTGIRDMSVIETPPHDRMPVTTYVIEQDEGVIAGAINKELRRAGQVYYIHNRIESIYSRAAKLHELCPDAVIGIAHGRMDEEELLKVWRRLLDREIDVLVCTTLIETGIDVPNVNTLIIENADRMGLAQLHQLRGRVGRTNRRAYAYFTFKRGKLLTEIAEKRLNAVREFTQFGAGFKIALRDLEIRGAGSVLGESQSGHMSAVGYEMYVKLLGEAVTEARDGMPTSSESLSETCVVDIKIDAFIPENYIFNQAQRIMCYKKIAEIRDEDDAFDIVDELTDRYGEIPKSVKGLIEVARLRNSGAVLGISEIVHNKDILILNWNSPDMERIARASAVYEKRLTLNLTEKTGLSLKLISGEGVLDAATGLLKQLTGDS
ncbi:MAG: transcription-repair coupling factor [Oscillospiraceae bacterium]|nr:transcription-repair coupling factor [Oscillospiraceae bacterium]